MRKNCSSDREKVLKFEAEVREFAKFLRSLEQFIQTVNFMYVIDPFQLIVWMDMQEQMHIKLALIWEKQPFFMYFKDMQKLFSLIFK